MSFCDVTQTLNLYDKLLLFGAESGLLDAEGRLVRELRPQQVPAHMKRLGSDYQAELLEAAAEACSGGVARSHIVSYAEDGALLTELFTRNGGGTLVAQEQFEVTREAAIEDVGGLLELISPLEEQGILVRRSREVLEREIEQFSVVEREGMIIACAALYQIADSDAGELACLAVNPEYRHGRRGDELLERIESRARAQGLKTLFVLTTRTAHWFRERGFEPSSVERLPAARAGSPPSKRASRRASRRAFRRVPARAPQHPCNAPCAARSSSRRRCGSRRPRAKKQLSR